MPLAELFASYLPNSVSKLVHHMDTLAGEVPRGHSTLQDFGRNLKRCQFRHKEFLRPGSGHRLECNVNQKRPYSPAAYGLDHITALSAKCSLGVAVHEGHSEAENPGTQRDHGTMDIQYPGSGLISLRMLSDLRSLNNVLYHY